jgi:predicted dehydrogenase
MESKSYKWGIIGCGDVTELKSGPAFQKIEGFEIYAVMRRNLEKVIDYAKRHQIPKYYTDADELINDPNIDAVYIATPPDSHKEYALKVVQSGKVCCIEKPMAPDYKDCVEIVNAFQEKQIPLYVSYYRRSLPRFNKIKQLIEDYTIGKVRHVSWLYTRSASPVDLSKAYNWRTDKEIAFGGYFDDLASHGLDLFIYYFGYISDASGFTQKQQDLYTSQDAIVGSWIYKSGVTGSGTWNFGADKREDRVEIIGDKGKIVFSVFNEEDVILETGEDIKRLFIENPKNIQLHHVDNMKLDLDGVSSHPSTGESATHTAWVMDKILGKMD